MSRIRASRDYLLATAQQLEQGKSLTPDQMKYWATLLRRIGEGESADEVLNLKRKRGEKESDEIKRQKISFVLHLIASYHNPWIDPRLDKENPTKLSLEAAILKVLDLVPKIMGDDAAYSYEQVRTWWYDADKKHMQSPFRGRFDPDTPIHLDK